eukprot:Pompholyxophrys_sp_v1_NODE_1_length_32789_cov_6.460653.p23 type:complete len:174 gc:universal NODE_1_length_32789_cov_6.460653:11708-11187(-)
MWAFICSLAFAKGINHCYEKPWIDFFVASTKALIIETLIVVLLSYFWSEQIKLLYSIYCYVCLLRTAFVFYRSQLLLQRISTSNKTFEVRLSKINYGIITLLCLLAVRNFIFQHLCIDAFFLIVIVIIIYTKRGVIGNVFRLIFSNLTTDMKHPLYIYALMNVINVIITLYII